jgi:hypothetical protein
MRNQHELLPYFIQLNHGPKPLGLYDITTNYYSGNKRAEFPSFRRKPESIKKTGCRIKSGMTTLKVFTCRCNSLIYTGKRYTSITWI